jgi:hypothetical protein
MNSLEILAKGLKALPVIDIYDWPHLMDIFELGENQVDSIFGCNQIGSFEPLKTVPTVQLTRSGSS